jgi:hypothetical protein
MRLATSVILPLLAGLGGGCDLELAALTAPPPGATAVLTDDDRKIEISRGAALAIGCGEWDAEDCDGLTVEIADPEIAGVRLAYRNALAPAGAAGPRPARAFVLFGRAAGETDLFVDAAAGSSSYRVTVLP